MVSIPISDLCIKEPVVDLDSILLVMVQTADCILCVYLLANGQRCVLNERSAFHWFSKNLIFDSGGKFRLVCVKTSQVKISLWLFKIHIKLEDLSYNFI
ncbi:hypothetical protein Hanom_Chr04g00294711 [Helianthus anomalus]